MYLRAAHAERHIPTLRAFIRDNPLGIFTTAIDSASSFPFLQSSHIPFLLDVQDDASETELGVLRGHMARANPQAKALMEHLKATSAAAAASPSDADNAAAASEGLPQTLSRDVMILFNAPAHHYVTPKFYTATKPSTGKVVPTWNYAAVQAYGRATVYFDSKAPSTEAFLAKQVAELSQLSETRIMGYEKPWKVDDAPKAYTDALKKAIIGIEIEITDLGGKWKMSQEMGVGDRQGVVEGFEALGTEVGGKVAGMVRERGVWE
ncbi:putative transcriptional protein [Lasiodiplodia theobromae]|nr:putative transcriptional protein [Lasiodiplodia theobromae]